MEQNTFFRNKENLILQNFNGSDVCKEIPVRGYFTLENEALSGDQFNELASTAIVLLEPGCSPHPGDRIRRQDELYSIGLVEIKKSVNGEIRFFRCACSKIN